MMSPHRVLTCVFASALIAIGLTKLSGFDAAAFDNVGDNPARVAAGTSTLEAGFSPDRSSAEDLVLKVIGSAGTSLKMSAYSFTSPTIVRAMLDAKRRGVHVQLIADERSNLNEDRSGKARHALNAVAEAGIEVRTISAYAINHDKLMIVDGRHIETGSFNYSTAAARRNSENVLVVWNSPELATIYLRHWEKRWSQGRDYQQSYPAPRVQ